MTSDLVLHYAPDNASLCVRLVPAELAVPYSTVLVDRRTGEHRSADYLTLNPNGLIPTLQTPHGPMFETGAILLWLADTRPGHLFPPPNAPERGPALSRLIWLANTVHPALRMLFYPDQYAPGSEDILRNHTRSRLCDLWDQMNADMGHLIADAPSIIACYLGPMLRWCALYGGDTSWFDLSRWPALAEFAATFETRDTTRTVTALEGRGPTPFSNPSYPNSSEGHAL